MPFVVQLKTGCLRKRPYALFLSTSPELASMVPVADIHFSLLANVVASVVSITVCVTALFIASASIMF